MDQNYGYDLSTNKKNFAKLHITEKAMLITGI